MAEQDKKEQGVSFKDTLNLPRTDFPMQANASINDPAMLKRWSDEDICTVSYNHNHGKETFILHDGPPYANGHIHLGHAYNKILKDIVTKSQRMQGKHVPVKPGWDCHGLPIELKVTQENPGLEPQELKKACRAYAQQWIDIQKAEFKKLGVFMDWQNPYMTMSYDYEASILRAFGTFVADGYIQRKNKTVPWCPSDQTVLAAAEIEYQDRKDPSIYVLFPLEQQAADALFPALNGAAVNFVIWTTTPWTLPLNRAVILNPGATYCVLDINGQYCIVAESVADKLCALVGVEKNIVATTPAHSLQGSRAVHPFIEGLSVPVLLDDSVSLEDGTACVHSAPGCGPEDYEIGIRNNLEIFSPLSPDGKYTVGIEPRELEGMPVTDGQIWVIKKLAEVKRLLFKQTITHSYPHCWRCRKGLIFRATKQWFCNLAQGGLKERAVDAVDTIAMLPEKSGNRLKATMDGRLEWCLSRQRIWGVPIPAFMCTKCDFTYVTQGLVEKVAAQVEKHGIEYWDDVVPQELMPQGFTCPMCKGSEFKKEQDILDVWFDSGVSHFAVLVKDGLGFPADMYLEGKDQHRGWFQSSLLTAMVVEGHAPMKSIMTHGFTVDEKGRKMSKSLGNVVAPDTIIDELGTDGLRLWVASIDYADDAVVSKVLMQNVKEVYRKIRNTCRFLLSNLYDFDIDKDAVPLNELRVIDRYALQQLVVVNDALRKEYNDRNFTAIFHGLAQYCTVDLSAFYLDITKDRLYVEQADGASRRSAQTACWHILDTLTKLMAPVLSFTAEYVSDYYQKDKKVSIHLQNFSSVEKFRKQNDNETPIDLQSFRSVEKFRKQAENDAQWVTLKAMRSDALKQLELLRAQGTIKHSLEAHVAVHMDESLLQTLHPLFADVLATGQTVEDFLKEFFIVSSVSSVQTAAGLEQGELPGLYVSAQHALGDKCPRCWNWDVTTDEHKLCRRCQRVLKRSAH